MDSVDDRTTEIWSSFREYVDSVGDRFLLFGGQCRPPVDELVGDLDLPHSHQYEPGLIMSQDSYPGAQFAQPIRNDDHSRTGAVGQVDGAGRPLIARPPTITVLASPAGIISCHGWAVMQRVGG